MRSAKGRSIFIRYPSRLWELDSVLKTPWGRVYMGDKLSVGVHDSLLVDSTKNTKAHIRPLTHCLNLLDQKCSTHLPKFHPINPARTYLGPQSCLGAPHSLIRQPLPPCFLTTTFPRNTNSAALLATIQTVDKSCHFPHAVSTAYWCWK
jgi:hypothetical protein